MLAKRVLIVIATSALMLGVASCGGSDDGNQGSVAASTESSAQFEANADSETSEPASGNSGHALSEAQFVKQANGICQKARKELVGALIEYRAGQDAQRESQEGLLEVTRDVLLPGMEKQIEALRALNSPPPASARQVETFLASWQRALHSAATESTPLTGAHAKKVLGPVGDQARKAGLGQCAYS